MDDLTFASNPRISPAQFARVLIRYHSPAAPIAADLYQLPLARGIDPAIALAFFMQESNCGTAPNWDASSRNWGNLRAGTNQHGHNKAGFGIYLNWQESLIDWCELIANYGTHDMTTVRIVLPAYAPSSDHNEPVLYAERVIAAVTEWRIEDIATQLAINMAGYDKARLYPNDSAHGYGAVVAGGATKRNPQDIRAIIVHTTNGATGSAFEAEADFLYRSLDVSAHYLVGKKGQIVQFLDPEWIAWHAGPVSDLDAGNLHSIGIENHLTPGEPWMTDQKLALTRLCKWLLLHYPTITKIVTHRQVATPPGRKVDPSEWSDHDFALWAAELLKRQW